MTRGLSGAILPTAVSTVRDLSGPLHGASADGSLRLEACVCGGTILAPRRSSGIYELQAHQQTAEHRDLRRRMGW